MNSYIILLIIASVLFYAFWKFTESPKKSEKEIQLDESFRKWKNRKIYPKLTKEIIASLSDDILEQTIFDNIYLIIGDDFKNELSNIKKLSKGQQAFWSTWIIEGEVNNGGFNQFYFNSSGQYAEMAEVGFTTIGAEKFSELTIRANKIHLENKERLDEFDDGTLESFSESYKNNPLNDLDTEFYNLSETEKIGELRIKYIRENVNEFTTD